MASVLDHTMTSIDGKSVDLRDYSGKVALIVNTASECGLTPHYKGLQSLHERFGDRGLAVLGFPSNDFGAQEPGSDSQIQSFCRSNYGVSFDMFSKIVVKGAGKAPLYEFLTSSGTNPEFPGEIEWNFEKFLVGRDGRILKRFKPPVEPESDEIISAIEGAL
jgi:glutathione peroxidase